MRRQFVPLRHQASDQSYWEENWRAEDVGRQIESLRWSEYIPIFERHVPVDGLILENGCGLGAAAQWFHRNGRRVVGLDYALKPLVRLKEYLPSLPLVNGDGFRLPFADASFATCVSLGVVEHFTEGPARLIAECRRILAPGGRLVISVPYYNLVERFRLALGPNTGVFYQHLFTRAEFARFLAAAGLEVEAVYNCNKLGALYYLYYRRFRREAATPSPGGASPAPAATAPGRSRAWLTALNHVIPPQISTVMLAFVARKPAA